MSLRNEGNRLATITKELVAKWRDTAEYWQDSKAAEFEKTYIAELQAAVHTAVIVIEQLDKVVGKIKKDCE